MLRKILARKSIKSQSKFASLYRILPKLSFKVILPFLVCHLCIEFNEDVQKVGINPISVNLMDLKITDEQTALVENINCFDRLLNDYAAKAIDAYIQMNEFFAREPFDEKTLLQIFQHLVNTRFRMIELIGILQTNQIIKKKKILQKEI